MDTGGTETCLSVVFSVSLALVINDNIYFLEMFKIINTVYSSKVKHKHSMLDFNIT